MTCHTRRCPMCCSHDQYIEEDEAVSNDVRSGVLHDLVLAGWRPEYGDDRQFVAGVMCASQVVILTRRLTNGGLDPESWRDSDMGTTSVEYVECGSSIDMLPPQA